MSENYIVINGKKMDLTEEQLKQLGIKVRNNPFERIVKGERYFYINVHGAVHQHYDAKYPYEEKMYDIVNYFADENFAHQVALHQLLYRKLLKFAYDNECEDNQEWGNGFDHWHIYYEAVEGKFCVEPNATFKYQGVYFSTRKGAERAIKVVVEPFMKEHPEFIW